MAPLNDLPAGHFQRNGGSIRALQPFNSHCAGEDQSTGHGESPIQAMLKKHTENGDEVRFSPKRNYKPPSTLRGGPRNQRPGQSPSSADLAFSRWPQQQNIYNSHQIPPTSSDAASPSRAYFPRHESRRGDHRDETVEDYRLRSMTQKSHVTQPVNRHPNQIVMYQGRGYGPNGRPRSPYAYPTRLKRPGYRPSSPAWSEFNQAGSRSLPGSRPTSPGSNDMAKATHLPWPQQISHSDMALMHYPPFLAQGGPFDRRPSPAFSRTPASRPTPSLRSTTSSSELRGPGISASSPKPSSDTFPAAPQYYDYSEDFEGDNPSRGAKLYVHDDFDLTYTQKCPTGDYRSMTKSIDAKSKDHLTPYMTTVPEALLENSKNLRPKDNPTVGYTPAKSFDVNSDHIIDKPSSSRTGGHIDEGNANDRAPIYIKDEAQGSYTFLAETSPQIANSKTMSPGTEIDSSVLRRYAESLSSTAGSMQTAEFKPNVERENDESETPESRNSPTFGGKVSAENSDGRDSGSQDTIIKQVQGSEGWSLSEPTEIVSPTPEHSVMSLANRHRFSKILSVDERSHIDGEGQNKIQQSLKPELINGELHKKSINIDQPESSADPACLEEMVLINETPLSPGSAHLLGGNTELADMNPSSPGNMEKYPYQEGFSKNSFPKDTKSPTKKPLHFHEALIGAIRSPNEVFERDYRISAAVAAGSQQSQVVKQGNSGRISESGNTANGVKKRPRDIIAICPPANEGKLVTLPLAFQPFGPGLNKQYTSTELESLPDPIAKGAVVETTDSTIKPSRSQNNHQTSDRASIASSHTSRPWNRNSNYPWNDKTLDLDVNLPVHNEDTPEAMGRFPRFKLRVHRASTSTTGTARWTKSRASSELVGNNKRNSGGFLSQSSIMKIKQRQKLPLSPGQANSSHAIGNDRSRSRFVESFDKPPQLDTVIASSAFMLLPPSPGHDVHSFFSDDSSQFKQKTSLRKRISRLKVRRSQSISAEDMHVHDKGLLRSTFGRPRASGRTSRQSQNTTATSSYKSNAKRLRSRFFHNVILWWHHGEDRVRVLRSRLTKRQSRDRKDHIALYADT